MKRLNWRTSIFSTCLVAIALASTALNINSVVQTQTSSRSIASEFKAAMDRIFEEEILIVTGNKTIYKRTKYIESIRIQVKDDTKLLAKIKAKDIEIQKKAKDIEKLKGQSAVAKQIIEVAIEGIKTLAAERDQLQSDLAAVQRIHAQKEEQLNKDIESLTAELNLKVKISINERALKEQAVAVLEKVKVSFSKIKVDLEKSNSDLALAKEQITGLESEVEILTNYLKEKSVLVTEKETKIKEQSDRLEKMQIAECKQQQQLEDLQKQVQTFETDKSKFDDVIKALKDEKITLAKERKAEKEAAAELRKTEKKEILALLGQFSMFANIASSPAPQMPQVTHNALTNPSLVDWNQYMMLAMMGNMSRTRNGGMFDFSLDGGILDNYGPSSYTRPRAHSNPYNPWGGYAADYGLGGFNEVPARGRVPAYFQF